MIVLEPLPCMKKPALYHIRSTRYVELYWDSFQEEKETFLPTHKTNGII